MNAARRGRPAARRAVLGGVLALLAMHLATPAVEASHTVELDPSTGPPSSPVTVTAEPVFEPCEVLWGATGEVLLSVEDCAAPGGELSVTVPVPADATPGPHEIIVCSSAACGGEIEDAVAAPFEVQPLPAGQVVEEEVTVGPEIELLPTVGPPGTVVRVTVSGLTAEHVVAIGWDPGVGSLVAAAGEDGTARGELLVLRGDVTGPRRVIAWIFSPGQIPFAGQTTAAPDPQLEASFLVTSGTAQPPDFATRR